MGYTQDGEKIDDRTLAAETRYTDVIIGAHTHTDMAKAALVLNAAGRQILVGQAGWGGEKIGRMEYRGNSKKESKLFNAQSVRLTKQTSAV